MYSVGVVVTAFSDPATQPTCRWAWGGLRPGFKAATLTTALTAQFARQQYQTGSASGQTSISAGVTVAPTHAVLRGRFYFQGILVEDEGGQ